MSTVSIGNLVDFANGEAKQVRVADRVLVVVRIDDSVYVLDDRCSHEDFSLASGEVDVDDCAIECARHGAMFSLQDGTPQSFPATQPVRRYEVINTNGALEVVVA